jgi:hypothetical protein
MIELTDAMTLPEMLNQLQDIEMPVPVAYTPETAGWWVALALLAASSVAFAFFLRQRRQANRYRTLALVELSQLEHIERTAGTASPEVNLLTQAAALVRRTALAVFPRKEIAHLHGSEWQTFLQNSSAVTPGVGLETLVSGPYRPIHDHTATNEALSAARCWIETHHV